MKFILSFLTITYLFNVIASNTTKEKNKMKSTTNLKVNKIENTSLKPKLTEHQTQVYIILTNPAFKD